MFLSDFCLSTLASSHTHWVLSTEEPNNVTLCKIKKKHFSPDPAGREEGGWGGWMMGGLALRVGARTSDYCTGKIPSDRPAARGRRHRASLLFCARCCNTSVARFSGIFIPRAVTSTLHQVGADLYDRVVWDTTVRHTYRLTMYRLTGYKE